MASKILSVTKGTIPPGKKNAGQPFWTRHILLGSMSNPKPAKAPVFLTGNAVIDAMITEYWDGIIASKNYPAVDIRPVIVGDPSINPNDKPLPPFRRKHPDTGVLMPEVFTSMRVQVEYEEGQPVVTPRNIATRVIDTFCERVVFTDNVHEGEQPDVL